MALPTDSSKLDEFFDDLLYSGAYFSFTKGFAPQGKKVLESRENVVTVVASRRKRRDEFVQAQVKQAIAWDALRAPLESFERNVGVHFDTNRKEYAKVFAGTVNSLLYTTPGSRAAAFKPVLDFAARNGLNGTLAATAKTFRVAWDEYAAAAAAVGTAATVLEKAIKAVALAKHGGVVALREADANARLAYAEAPTQARKFQRSRGTGKVNPATEVKRLEKVLEKVTAALTAAREKAETAKARAVGTPPVAPQPQKIGG